MGKDYYFKVIYDFFGIVPTINKDIKKDLFKKEKELGVKLPAAMKEFYIISDGQETDNQGNEARWL